MKTSNTPTSSEASTSFVWVTLRENPLLVIAGLIAAAAIVWGTVDFGSLVPDEAPAVAQADETDDTVAVTPGAAPSPDTPQQPATGPDETPALPANPGIARTIDGKPIEAYPYVGVPTKGNVDRRLLNEASADTIPIATAAVAAMRSPSYRDETANEWLRRVEPFLEPSYATLLRRQRGGANGAYAWAQFRSEQREYRVRIDEAILTDFYPHHGSSLVIGVTYLTSASAAGGPWSQASTPRSDFVHMAMNTDGQWLVTDIVDTADRTR